MGEPAQELVYLAIREDQGEDAIIPSLVLSVHRALTGAQRAIERRLDQIEGLPGPYVWDVDTSGRVWTCRKVIERNYYIHGRTLYD